MDINKEMNQLRLAQGKLFDEARNLMPNTYREMITSIEEANVATREELREKLMDYTNEEIVTLKNLDMSKYMNTDIEKD